MDKKEYHLGINPIGHDTGLAVMDESGRPVVIYEESKFNGLKCAYDHLPFSINQISKDGFSHFETLNWAVYENQVQFLDKEGNNPSSLPIIHGLKKILAKHFSWSQENIVPHHMAHLESAFRCSGFNKSLVVSCDGDGGVYSIRVALGDLQTGLNIVEDCSSEFSYGALFNVLTSFIGYRREHPLVHAGKLMGLSGYGSPTYLDTLKSLFPIPKGALFPNTNPRGIYWPSVFKYPPFKNIGNTYSKEQADISYSLQLFLENEMIRILNTLRTRYPAYNNLCLAGGVALNSLMNGKVLRSEIFNKIFIQPQASDCGLATGSALFGLNKKEKKVMFRWPHAFWGFREENEAKALYSLLKIYNLPITTKSRQEPIQKIAGRLINGEIVALFQHAGEVGPRSLGNRSILCLPSSEMRDKINKKVKFREAWRPFAPVVLEEAIGEYFEFDRPEPFMTIVYDVKPKWRNTLGGITHIDGSARVQSVNESQNPYLYNLLKELKEQGEPPILLNTSFNINGQPIVRSVYDAAITFLGSAIDVLMVDGCLVQKRNRPKNQLNTVISAGDRSIEPILRKASKISVALFPPNRDTLEQLDSLLNFPALKYRRNETLFPANLYARTNPFAFDEILSQYDDKFQQISGLPNQKIRVSDSEVLIVMTGSNLTHATTRQDVNMCRGNTNAGINLPDQTIITDILDHILFNKNSINILITDNQWRVIPGDYFSQVCLQPVEVEN